MFFPQNHLLALIILPQEYARKSFIRELRYAQHKMFSFLFDQPVLVLPDGLEYNEYNDIFGIPNKEVSQEYVNALSTMNWHGVTASDIQKIANA